MKKPQSIIELTQGEVILKFEGFTIRKMDGWHLWMENGSGEGTQIRRDEFLVVLDRLFKKNF